MTLEAVKQVLGRAILDSTFRQQFLGNPDSVLRDFPLSSVERGALLKVTAQQMDEIRHIVQEALPADGLIKGDAFQKALSHALVFKMQSAGQVTEVQVLGYDDAAQKEIVGRASGGQVDGSRSILIGLSLVGILIGLLLFLPREGLLPMLGLGQMVPVSGQIPACPSGDSEGGDSASSTPMPFNVQFVLFLNGPRTALGSPLCADTPDQAGGGKPTDGGQTTSGGQTTGGASGACDCVGTDYICKNADGSVASASYNSTQCGGTGLCGCREPNKTLACPDGTYADFNPQCGVGSGGPCTCVPNPACQQFPPGQCAEPENICKENGKAC